MSWLVLETLKNGVVYGAMIASLALAFQWVYRTTGVFHVSLGISLLTGSYGAVYAMRLGNGLALATILGIASGALSGFAIMGLYRQMQRREASGSIKLVGSLGLYFASVGAVALLVGPEIKFAPSLTSVSRQLGQIIITDTDIRYFASCAGVVALAAWLIGRTPLGWHMKAVSGNRQLYFSLGYSEFRVLLLVTVCAGSIAGLFGAYEGVRNGVDPYGYLPLTMAAAVAALLARNSLVVGPTIAGLGLGILTAVTSQVLSDRWSDTIVYGVLLIVLVSSPMHATKLAEERTSR